MEYSRRKFLLTVGVVASGALTCTLPISGECAESYADPALADDWIKKSIQLHAATEPLVLGRFADPTYFLRQQIDWTSNPGQTEKAVHVPTGFVTDFASIPRIFWSALPKDGDYAYAAIFHDYLYWEQSVARDEADHVLMHVMQDFKVSKGTIYTIYNAVRLGGGSAWDENAKLKASGEKRILKKFPTDPTVRWKDWKKGPDNF